VNAPHRAIAFALIAVMAFSTGPLVSRAAPLSEKINEKERQVHATHEKLSQKKSELSAAQQRERDLQQQLAETNSGISRVHATLDELDGELRHNERRIAWNERQLDAARQTLARHNDALKRRLVDAYEHGDLGYINVLFSATSFNDFVERWDDIRFLIGSNARAVRERRAAEAKVATVQAGLESAQHDLETTHAQQVQANQSLASLASQRQMLLVMASDQRKSVAVQVAQLEELSAAEEASLEAMIVERQREEEARRAAERRAAMLAGRSVPEEGPPGTFSWPVAGPITSPFGLRPNPMGRGFDRHPGIDIGAPMGATIGAAAAGRVIMAHWYGGYGNAIIIDHGGDLVTLYGHCSQIFVSEGQDVQRGQAIGAVGSTGYSTGPHLHFEVRVHGVPVNPITRLR
jgi:murein DD-endopeptidase MepM/ murein hydrolase activator NlpD